ncbi:MAG TPA: tetratricopeptide repeat protein [Pyrinomonadaceae bacterium]|nr:tetratricopeptide repeat protein [Pyrinomonadaceae bacterium]
MKGFSLYGKILLAFGLFFLTGSAFGQDLGSSNGLFRSPNPKTASKPSASKPSSSNSASAKKSSASSTSSKKTTVAKSTKPPVKEKSTNNSRTKTGERNSTASVKRTTPKTVAKSTKTVNIQPSQNIGKTTVKPYSEENIVITVGQPSADFNEQFEKAIEEGNQARDDREYTKAEAAYLRAQSLKNTDSRAVYGLGNLFSDQQRWEEAENSYRTATQLEPNAPEPYIALSFVLTQPIVGTTLSERYAEAEKMARQAIQLDNQNALAYDQLGVALELRGIISDETVNAYKRAIQIDSEFALAYAHLGRLYRRKGQINDSSAAYRNAITLSNDVPTMILVADVMQSQQRYLESEQLLRRALRQDPKNPTALFLLGRALTTRGNFDEAEKVLNKSAEVSPNNFVSYMLLGSLYARQNKFDNAESALRRALRVVSMNEKKRLAQEFEVVGDGYLRSGKTTDAARVYRQAIELDREKSSLSSKLAKVQGS